MNKPLSKQLITGALLALAASMPMHSWAQASLGSPPNGGSVSGIGLIRGWLCTPPESGLVDIVIDGNIEIDAAYGTTREDTAEICTDNVNSGWGVTFNYNLLGDGQHSLTAFADGQAIGSSTFTVGQPSDEEFLKGAPETFYILPDFPDDSSATVVQWQEAEQNFVVVDTSDGVEPESGTWSNSESGEFDVCWNVSDNGEFLTSNDSSCEEGYSYILAATGKTDNGIDCTIVIASAAEVPIINGVFVDTFIDPVGVNAISSIVGKFTDTNNAQGRAVLSSATLDSCRVDFTNNKE